MKPSLITTTIGAFPKPNYVPVRDWFDLAKETGGMNTPETTYQYSKDVEKNKDTYLKHLITWNEYIGKDSEEMFSEPFKADLRICFVIKEQLKIMP